ncbi:hypothetical protein [Thiorhodococcus fuscus]|uniref:SPOR domain-containing protein n=1 Tax=Thiorhodococcus fuscus TaxID=527200 RepID=A0ABW4Y6R3_9GAMM
MANADNAAPRSSLGWLPKLVLWGVVIAFGYLYLSSIDREEGKPTAAAFMDSLAKLSPVPIKVLPNDHEGKASEAAEEPKVVATTVVEEHKPVREAESSVFANSLIKQQAPAPAVAEQPAEPPAAPAPGFMPQPMPVTPAFAAPAQAQAQVPAQVPAQEAPAVADDARQQMPSPVPAGSYGWEAANKRRAEMMARYEAMRREADARMRQQWEQMRAYAPPVPYGYGYPGYGPAAYPPGVYAPAQ